MEIQLLGLTEVRADGRRLDIGPPQRRAVLAALAAEAGRPVLTETLIDRIWGEAPPAQARAAIHTNITLIRRLLEEANAADPGRPPATLEYRAAGYILQVEPGRVDLLRFRELVAAALAGGRTAGERGELLQRALDLWQGPALADVPGQWPARMREGWGMERLDAAVEWARTELQLGHHEQVIGRVRVLIADYPLAEPLTAVLMRALAAVGRDAEALGCYAATRERLAEELGTDPGVELQELHRTILLGGPGDTPDPGAGPRPAPSACTLPADIAAFTGRDKELRAIVDTATAAGAGAVAAIHAVGGMPGIGKSALAVHIGHQLADRFPDRQLFVDLHAHTAGRQPTDPTDALAILLAADGVDPRCLPDELDGRAAMWRARMATRRMVLILDNAADSEQVAPLLPGAAGCLVLITSRRHLGDLPTTVIPVTLDILPADEAARMFRRLAPRAEAEPEKVAELVSLCGHLPLAISLLARLFTRHRAWNLDDLIRETTAKLLSISAENRTVAAAFDLSYRYLTADQQRFFRRLGLHPGVDIDDHAAAALTGTPLDQAIEHLDTLHSHHLVDEPSYRRYRMHDLIRGYAQALAGADPRAERERAVRRLLDHYRRTAERADILLVRNARPAPEDPIVDTGRWPTDRAHAQAWMDDEDANLLACIEYATRHELPVQVVGLTAAVAAHLRAHGRWRPAGDLHTAAAAAARRLGDRAGEADALTELGIIRRLTGDVPGATAAIDRSLELYREIGDRAGAANALTQLGAVSYVADDYPAATAALERALSIHRELGNRQGEVGPLTVLGRVRRLAEDYPGAIAALERALAISREVDDRAGQAETLTQLGPLRYLTGDQTGGGSALEQALQLSREIGDRSGQADALTHLGTARLLAGEYAAAPSILEHALGIYREIGNRAGHANVLTQLGYVRSLTGDHPAVLALAAQALAIYRAIGDRFGQAYALAQLGSARYAINDHGGAAAVLDEALEVFREIGNRTGEAEVCNHLGALHLAGGDPHRARAHFRRSRELARAIPVPLEETRAVDGIELCDKAIGGATGQRGVEQLDGVPDR